MLLSFLALPVAAEEIWVKNKPFKGEVAKSGTEYLVEAEPFLKALKMELTIAEGKVMVKDVAVPVTVSTTGKSMLPLQEFGKAAGLVIKKNADFGQIDVFPPVNEDIGEASTYTSRNYGYTLQIPAGYSAISDAKTMSSLEDLQKEGAEGVKFDVIVDAQSRTNRSGNLMVIMVTLPQRPTPEQLARMRTGVVTPLARGSSTPIAGPVPVALGGRKFDKYSNLTLQMENQTGLAELYTLYEPTKNLFYMFMIVDDQDRFGRSAPVLRSIIESLQTP